MDRNFNTFSSLSQELLKCMGITIHFLDLTVVSTAYQKAFLVIYLPL